jgi:hypothetical protein
MRTWRQRLALEKCRQEPKIAALQELKGELSALHELEEEKTSKVILLF